MSTIVRILTACTFSGGDVLSELRAFVEAAVVHDAELVAFGHGYLCLAWESDAVEELVLFFQARACQASFPLAVGVSEGEVTRVMSAAPFMWGDALDRAEKLARVAPLGSMLVDDQVAALRRGELSTAGTFEGALGDEKVEGQLLNLDEPWASPPLSKRSDAPPAYVRASHRSGVATGLDVEVRESWGPNKPLAEHVRSMLTSGRAGEALNSLRKKRLDLDGADSVERCQASLALGVALFVFGRLDEALLEGLDAVARAREGGDRRAEEAALSFLAKLFLAEKFHDEASKLGLLAKRKSVAPSSPDAP